jgi:transglutaminase-like putative cysteine protease
MFREYSIHYKTENHYENWVNGGLWQFLIIPEENDTQSDVATEFSNSLHAKYEFSINGRGFKTIRLSPGQKFRNISFEAFFTLIKKEVNPFDFEPTPNIEADYDLVSQLNFQVDQEPFLHHTHFTNLPKAGIQLFEFDRSKSIFENLLLLNNCTSQMIDFEAGVTNVETTLSEVIINKRGVCQDFTHLFCALARQNGIPARYVSGYLHQGNGYFGDSQMHAWAEAYVPQIGWLGFDPTNNLIANANHIKVAHGRDYSDCSPLKGVLFTTGKNKTSHSVHVSSQQQQ